MPAIQDARILIVATNGFEQSELEVPRDKLRDHGATVHVATPDGGAIKGWDEDDWGREAQADLKLADARVEEYHALVLPGGQINPDLLRVNEDALRLIRDFVSNGRVVAAICHAPWLLIEAGVARASTIFCWLPPEKLLAARLGSGGRTSKRSILPAQSSFSAALSMNEPRLNRPSR